MTLHSQREQSRYIKALPVASNEIVNLNSAQGNLAITEFKNELSQNDWALT